MNRPVRCAVPVLLAIGLWQAGAIAQPAAPNSLTSPKYSIAELERFLGGQTLITVDLKGATLDEVAAALSQTSGQKFVSTRPLPPGSKVRSAVVLGSPAPAKLPQDGVAPPPATTPAPATVRETATEPPKPLFTLSATKKPFWEALRGWQLAARREAEAADKLAPKPVFSNNNVPNSLGVQKDQTGFLLQPSNSLADGRAVAVWPYLVVATDLRRSQEARLSETGLREIESRPAPFSLRAGAKTPAVAPANTPQTPVAEEKRWSDRLALTLFTFADPKLAPSGLRCEIVEATDNKGNDLRLGANEEVRSFSGSYSDPGGGPPLQIELASRPDMGERLIRLRGVLHFSVVTRVKHWETTQLQTPVEDTIQEAGGEFKVQFKGVESSGQGWTASFAAQSSGAHLERFWRSRVGGFVGREGFVGGNSSKGILNFEGVPQMRLVDENGVNFEFGPGMRVGNVKMGSMFELEGKNPETGVSTPAPASLDVSPLPPDVAQNWKYREEQNFGFRRPFDWAPDGGMVMGRPVKLVVDFPVERREISVPFEFTDLPLPPS